MIFEFAGQGKDLLDFHIKQVRDAGGSLTYPVDVFVVVSTGLRYLMFSLAYYTPMDARPTLLYHGAEQLHVQPCSCSGLPEGGTVLQEEVERIVALFVACLNHSISSTVDAFTN